MANQKMFSPLASIIATSIAVTLLLIIASSIDAAPFVEDSAYPTGDRAIIRVRGARNNYHGSPPSNIRIEDDPYRRGPYPRGVYSDQPRYPYNNDMMGYGGPMMGLMSGYGYRRRQFGYDGGYGGYGDYSSRYPSTIAVTGAFPIPSRYPPVY